MRKASIIGGGVFIMLAGFWGGSWLVHIVPDYLGLAAFETAAIAVLAGAGLVSGGLSGVLK